MVERTAQSARGLSNAAAVVAFCTPSYGQRTGHDFFTYEELRYIYEKRGPVIPLRMHKDYPPCPGEEVALSLCKLVFSPGLVYINGVDEVDGKWTLKSEEIMAELIYERLRQLNLDVFAQWLRHRRARHLSFMWQDLCYIQPLALKADWEKEHCSIMLVTSQFCGLEFCFHNWCTSECCTIVFAIAKWFKQTCLSRVWVICWNLCSTHRRASVSNLSIAPHLLCFLASSMSCADVGGKADGQLQTHPWILQCRWSGHHCRSSFVGWGGIQETETYPSKPQGATRWPRSSEGLFQDPSIPRDSVVEFSEFPRLRQLPQGYWRQQELCPSFQMTVSKIREFKKLKDWVDTYYIKSRCPKP